VTSPGGQVYLHVVLLLPLPRTGRPSVPRIGFRRPVRGAGADEGGAGAARWGSASAGMIALRRASERRMS
jgi:hypothetical protein